MAADPALLPRRLSQVVNHLANRDLAHRLRQVYGAAAQSIARLSDMDLVRYEPEEAEESPDLALWEEMAPVIRDTLLDVNGLLAVIREQLPEAEAEGVLDSAVGGPIERQHARTALTAVHAVMGRLGAQISELGESMRSPQVVSDRWNLLAEVQRFRTRFREEIGTLVFESAAAFEEVHPSEVVPGFEDEVASAVQVRATVADLGRVMEARLHKIHEAESEDVQWHAQQWQRELDLFGRTPAYRAMRAQDKRAVLEFRHKLGKLAIQANPDQRDLKALAEPFAEQVRGLARVNRRQILINHDREVLASCGVRLESSEQLLRKDPLMAAKMLSEAAAAAQSLYGRDSALDAFLRKAKKNPLITLKGGDLKASLDEFRDRLADLQL